MCQDHFIQILISESENIGKNHSILIDNNFTSYLKLFNKRILSNHIDFEQRISEKIVNNLQATYLYFKKNIPSSNNENPEVCILTHAESKNVIQVYFYPSDNHDKNPEFGYLYLMSIYHLLIFFLERKTIIKINDIIGDPLEVFINNKEDIYQFFDKFIDIKFYKNKELFKCDFIPYSLSFKIENGYEVIKILECNYEDATKLEIFPQEWLM